MAEVSVRLSEQQVLALAEVADGVEGFAHPRTLSSLRGRGLVVRTRLDWQITPRGRAALDVAKAQMPGLFRYDTPTTTHPTASAGLAGTEGERDE